MGLLAQAGTGYDYIRPGTFSLHAPLPGGTAAFFGIIRKTGMGF